MQTKNARDTVAGLMFTAVGVAFAIGATNYSFGSSVRPGPGYFPLGLGVLMALLGLAILVRARLSRAQKEQSILPIAWRPLGVIVFAIVVFGLALPHLGLLITLPLLIVIVSAAGDQFRWRGVIGSSIVLTLGSWLVFSKGLGLTIPVWPAFAA